MRYVFDTCDRALFLCACKNGMKKRIAFSMTLILLLLLLALVPREKHIYIIHTHAIEPKKRIIIIISSSNSITSRSINSSIQQLFSLSFSLSLCVNVFTDKILWQSFCTFVRQALAVKLWRVTIICGIARWCVTRQHYISTKLVCIIYNVLQIQ